MLSKSLLEYAFVAGLERVEENNSSKFSDNVAVAKKDLSAGLLLNYKDKEIKITQNIAVGGVFSIVDIKKGGDVIFLCVVIGCSIRNINAGELISEGNDGNIVMKPSKKNCDVACKNNKPVIYDPSLLKRTFKGFRCKVTKEGEIGGGTENFVVLLNTVKCSAVAVKNIAYQARKKLLKKYPNVSDVVVITHESGCGMPEGKSRDELLRVLINIMNHPNIRVVYLLGLGCEHLTVSSNVSENIVSVLRSEVINFDCRVITDSLQKYKSEVQAINYIVDGPLNEIFSFANKFEREPLPLSYITLGLKCGGSDIFSGICSNPVLGVAVDKLIRAGGAAIITEIPEFDGYMSFITRRARNKRVSVQLNNLLPRFEKMSRQYPISGKGRQKIAPGNKQGGLLNVFMKSASASQKSGSSQVEGVLEYCDWIYERKYRGLWVLNCPSYDQISTPALGLSGAQIVAFTTGLGTPIGSALSQVVKIGNRRIIGLKDHIDFFAEDVLYGESVEKLGDKLFELIISVASGEKITKVQTINRDMAKRGFSELHHEFMLWKRWGDN